MFSKLSRKFGLAVRFYKFRDKILYSENSLSFFFFFFSLIFFFKIKKNSLKISLI